MKTRFGIRERFALTVLVLVLAAALFVPRLLFKQTETVVIEHEIFDLRDEGALRCWEMIEAVNKLDSLLSKHSKTGFVDVARHLEKTLEGDPGPPDQQWWLNVEKILSLPAEEDASEFTTIFAAHGVTVMPPPKFINAVRKSDEVVPLEPRRGDGWVSEVTYSTIFGLDVPLRPRWASVQLTPPDTPTQRLAALWGGIRGSSRIYLVLASLPASESPRHLAWLFDAERGCLMNGSPGWRAQAEDDPFDDADLLKKVDKALFGGSGPAVPPGPFTLRKAFERHSMGISRMPDEILQLPEEDRATAVQKFHETHNWRGAETKRQVEYGALLEQVVISPSHYFFLEGRATESFRDAFRAADRNNRMKLENWFSDLRLTGRRKGWHTGGLLAGAREIRFLAESKEKVIEARDEMENSLRGRFGNDYAVTWDDPVACQHGDMQLMRFFLNKQQVALPREYPRNMQDDSPPAGDDNAGANAEASPVAGTTEQISPEDPPYWFAYCAFREELTASINHEMKELRNLGIVFSVLAGIGAFLFAFWLVRPLIGITRTAQSVAAADSDKLPTQIEAVRHSLRRARRRKDEVGNIAGALDHLLIQVLNGHGQLRQAKAGLEKNVEERTAELRAANEELKGLADAKDSFLASVSHELRQPLNSIFGFLQFIEFSDLTEQQRQDVSKVRHAAGYLKRLIDDILDYQKIIMGGLLLEPSDIDTADFFGHLQASLEGHARERGNRLVFSGTDTLGTVHNDRERLQQILVNLLTNACKFTENGEVKLHARRDGTWLVIDVSDTGRGMKPEEMRALFKRFKKLASREGNRSGTGLGLVISKGLAELMGGSIMVSSEFGKGSTFTVRIPAELKNGAAEPPAAVEAPAAAIPKVTDRARTVLIIDDDPAVRELMGRYFTERAGCHVITAEDGDAGIALAAEHRPDLITLDVVMPGRDGWETLAMLKSRPETAGLPVAVVSFIDQASRGYALGATDYIVKPIDWDRLGHILRRHTGSELPVLIVDDDATFREILRRTLERDGWQVVEAADGEAARAMLEKLTPCAVLLDLLMPGVDGFQFLAAIRSDPRWEQLPVVVVTAHLVAAERAILEGSVCGIIEKNSLTPEKLLEQLVRCVARQLDA